MAIANSTPLRREWHDARAKVEREGRCRVCGSTRDLEAAHIIARRCDAEMTGPRGGRYLYVHPDTIVPLCGAFSERACHMMYDRRSLDLLPYLHLHEQIRAVEDAGGIMSALKRLGGSW
jgi:hypothetical protein